MNSDILKKLEGAGLREFIEAGDLGTVSVLVQPAAPPPRFTRSKGPPGAAPRWQSMEPGAGSEEETAESIDATRELIRSVTHREPHFIAAARAFVTDVSQQELREIVSSDAVASVSMNRALR